MKRILLLAGLVALAGCADNSQPRQTQNSKQPQHYGDRDSYPEEHMQKTGRQTAGGQLSQEDPAISVGR